jgi:hypothetical protein
LEQPSVKEAFGRALLHHAAPMSATRDGHGSQSYSALESAARTNRPYGAGSVVVVALTTSVVVVVSRSPGGSVVVVVDVRSCVVGSVASCRAACVVDGSWCRGDAPSCSSSAPSWWSWARRGVVDGSVVVVVDGPSSCRRSVVVVRGRASSWWSSAARGRRGGRCGSSCSSVELVVVVWSTSSWSSAAGRIRRGRSGAPAASAVEGGRDALARAGDEARRRHCRSPSRAGDDLLHDGGEVGRALGRAAASCGVGQRPASTPRRGGARPPDTLRVAVVKVTALSAASPAMQSDVASEVALSP